MLEAIVDHLVKNRDMIEIIFWWAYVDKINTAYKVGAYHSKVNYYIDKNEAQFEIKQLRSKINEKR